MHRIVRASSLGSTPLLMIALLFFFPFRSEASVRSHTQDPGPVSCMSMDSPTSSLERGRGLLRVAQGHQSERYRKRYEQWQNMDPGEKETLRRRMEQWNQMAPQDRQRYQRRYDQWKHLSPEEQRQIDRKLETWQNLSPAEREDVKKQFR